MNNEVKSGSNQKFNSDSSIQRDEQFFYGFLLLLGIKLEGVRIKTVAKIMAALEAEFQVRGGVFCKHFGKNVKDQEVIGGLSWEETVNVARKTFNTGFSQIGTTYCEGYIFEMDADENQFGDFFYSRLKAFHKNRTYYYRSELIASLLDDYEESLRINSGDSNNQELALAE